MKGLKSILLLLTTLLVSNTYGENITFYGFVYDEDGEKLPGVYIKLNEGWMQTISDMNGAFSFVLESDVKPAVIEASFLGYKKQTIILNDSVTNPIIISLVPNIELDSQDNYTVLIHPHDYKNKIPYWQFRTAYAIDMVIADFSEYEDILGNFNTDFMKYNGVFDFEFAFVRNRLDYGVGFGFIHAEDYNNDSVSVKFNTTQYSLKFGYQVLNSKRFTLTPKLNLKWKRYRLLNSDINRKTDLEEYIENRDIDLRFNQTYLSTIIDFAYKLPVGVYSSDNVSIGAYCGYIIPLNNTPWVYSKGNRLITDRNITINNINWGIYVALTIEE